MSAIVVKLGGEVIRSEGLPQLASDLFGLMTEGRRIVLVHGGGPQATDLQKSLGQTPKIVAGRRITDAETLDVMKMVVAGKLNVDLCAALLAAGLSPIGLNGTSGLAICATKRPPRVIAGAGPDPIDFGLVGDVVSVREELVELLLDNGYVPVFACLGADASGAVYNINADAVASQVAIRLDADALILVTDVPGILRDVADPCSRIRKVTQTSAEQLIADGVVTKGMIPKVEECLAALRRGVRRVHVVGRLGAGDLLSELHEPGSRGTVFE